MCRRSRRGYRGSRWAHEAADVTSLDAGTPETYARIKGRAVFGRVVANVARYARANSGRTILKMIVSELLGRVDPVIVSEDAMNRSPWRC